MLQLRLRLRPWYDCDRDYNFDYDYEEDCKICIAARCVMFVLVHVFAGASEKQIDHLLFLRLADQINFIFFSLPTMFCVAPILKFLQLILSAFLLRFKASVIRQAP